MKLSEGQRIRNIRTSLLATIALRQWGENRYDFMIRYDWGELENFTNSDFSLWIET